MIMDAVFNVANGNAGTPITPSAYFANPWSGYHGPQYPAPGWMFNPARALTYVPLQMPQIQAPPSEPPNGADNGPALGDDGGDSDLGDSVSTAAAENFDVFAVKVWQPEKKTGGKITIKRRTFTAENHPVNMNTVRSIYRRYDPLLKLNKTHRMEVRDVFREIGLATSLITAMPHFDTPTQYALSALLAIHGLKETQEPETLNPLLVGDAMNCACCTTALPGEAEENEGYPCEYVRHLPDGKKCGATMEDETGKYWTCTTYAQGIGLFTEQIAGQKTVSFFCLVHYERALKHRMCPCATFMTASKRKTKNYRFSRCDKGHLFHPACAPVCPHDGH